MWGDIAIAFMLAFITTFVITPYTIKLAKKTGSVDTPKDERRINTTTWRACCYCRFYYFNYIFNYNIKYGKKY